jgi:hypothetical protein
VTAGENGAAVVLPPLASQLDVLWELILDLAEHLPQHDWVLVGGQMVMLHGLAAGRTPTRASKDVDVLADLVSAPTRPRPLRRSTPAAGPGAEAGQRREGVQVPAGPGQRDG